MPLTFFSSRFYFLNMFWVSDFDNCFSDFGAKTKCVVLKTIKIWHISLQQGPVHVDKCIRSNDRVLAYTNAASSRQEGSLTGLWCSHYARMARAVAL